jgi:hypothetical protein
MKKNYIIVSLITFIIAVLIVLGLSRIFFNSNKEVVDTTTATTTPVATRPSIQPIASSTIVGKYDAINLAYPSSVPEISDYVNKVKAEFLDSVPKTDKDAQDQGLGGSRNYTLDTKTMVYTSPTTVTYYVETYMFTGGAHGSTVISTFTYGPDNKLISLKDLYATPDALTKISNAARTYLKAKLGDNASVDEIDSGTTPTDDNFGVWYITDAGITFVFGQYQVGPYVIGIQEFPMSRSQASGILNL